EGALRPPLADLRPILPCYVTRKRSGARARGVPAIAADAMTEQARVVRQGAGTTDARVHQVLRSEAGSRQAVEHIAVAGRTQGVRTAVARREIEDDVAVIAERTDRLDQLGTQHDRIGDRRVGIADHVGLVADLVRRGARRTR